MERIHVDVPEQPPVGSVVLDSAGTAWQRRLREDGKPLDWTGTGSGVWLPWASLLVELGPLDVVHRAEAT